MAFTKKQLDAINTLITFPKITRMEDYQIAANAFLNPETSKPADRLDNAIFGLIGEIGEIADVIKKMRFHGHGAEGFTDFVVNEAGDVLWYLALLSNAIGTPLNEIAHKNIEKLSKRYPDGFSTERSVNRNE